MPYLYDVSSLEFLRLSSGNWDAKCRNSIIKTEKYSTFSPFRILLEVRMSWVCHGKSFSINKLKN